MTKAGVSPSDGEIITILLVDDIPETRENIKKLLAFEADFKVIGSVGTGREGVEAAKQFKPNIIIMDINMPDMDGIQATTLISESVPTAAVIMMSVQNDPDYLRRAMLAGARNFLTKPILPDELYNTIRTVHIRNKPLAANFRALEEHGPIDRRSQTEKIEGVENRAGHVIAVYSPQGGVGCTTVATNLASGLMKEGIRVLLVDADLQFGDVGVFLNVQGQSTIVDLVSNVDDIDIELFDNIVVTHESGLKVLMGPSRPEEAEHVLVNPSAIAQIIEKVRGNYDFIIVDTSSHLDEALLALFDIAVKIVLVATPVLSCVKNVRFVMDLFDQLTYGPEKTTLVLNRVPDDRNAQRFTISKDKIEKFLKRPVEAEIPSNETIVLGAMSKGVPVVASQRDRTKSPIKEMVGLSDLLFEHLMGNDLAESESQPEKARPKTGLGWRLGKA